MEEQQEVELMNLYQALPLTYRGMITEVGEDHVLLIAQPPDSVCLQWLTKVYLMVPEPLDLLEADVDHFDVISGVVRLSGLRFGGPRLGNRLITRVIPRSLVQVDIQTEETTLPAALLDLSIQGARLQVERGAVVKGQSIQMKIHLPEGEACARGVVQMVDSSAEKQHLSVVFDESTPSIRPIWQYISHRRMEILQELQEKYLEAYLQQATANQ